jgi:glycosyltransferase involved in cell wall biosynthesis
LDQGKFRILHFIEQFNLRGAELFASQLASALASLGHYNVLCSVYRSNFNGFPIDASIDSCSIQARKAGLWAKLGLQPSVLIKTIRLWSKYKPDIVLAHGSDTMKYVALASMFKPRPITIYRNIGTASHWLRSKLHISVNRKLLARVDAVVSVSQVSREDFISLYRFPPDRVKVILNAVNPDRYLKTDIEKERTTVRSRLGLAATDKILVSIGSLSPEKNQIELLNLIHQLEDNSLHLLLVGDGPLRQDLLNVTMNLQLQNRVHFLGIQPDVAPILAASDIFVLPSKSEGLPGVLIEAGMAGLPAVAYDVGGVKEVIVADKTGIIVPARNYEKFKSAVISLLADPEKRRQMGSLARQIYPERFDIRVIAKQYEAFFLNCCKKREDDKDTA